MTVTLTHEIAIAVTEQARREGTIPERLVPESLRDIFVAPKPTPNETLGLAAQVYAGLSEQDIREIEAMRRHACP